MVYRHADPEPTTAFTIYLAKRICYFSGVVGDQTGAVGIWWEDGKLSVAALLHLPKCSIKAGTVRGNVENLAEVV